MKQEVILIEPIDFGGLDIGNLRLLNEPLLAKWLWHFFIKPHVDVV